MNRHDYDSTMVLQATDTEALMKDINRMSFQKAQIAASLSAEKLKKAKRVILSGSGDSYASGVAAGPAFEALLGIPCESIALVELTRHYYSERFQDAVVILNSVSGGVSRVVEAAKRANKHGAYTVSLTANDDSKLSTECRTTVHMELPKKSNPTPSTPKVIAYTASCAGLLHIAVYMAELRGAISEETAQEMREEIFRYSTDALGAAMDTIAGDSFHIADTAWKDFKEYVFLGDGGDLGAAMFGAFKCPESIGRMAHWDDTENFNHVNYFMKDTDKVGTAVVVSSASPSMSRAQETLRNLLKLGRYTVAVSDAPASDFPEGVHVISLPKAVYPWLASSFLHLPLALLAAYSHAILNPEFVPYRNKGGLWTDPGAQRLTASELVIL